MKLNRGESLQKEQTGVTPVSSFMSDMSASSVIEESLCALLSTEPAQSPTVEIAMEHWNSLSSKIISTASNKTVRRFRLLEVLVRNGRFATRAFEAGLLKDAPFEVILSAAVALPKHENIWKLLGYYRNELSQWREKEQAKSSSTADETVVVQHRVPSAASAFGPAHSEGASSQDPLSSFNI
jgi:hypothetical protein